MQPEGLRGQSRHPHGATLAGPAENERDPGAERLSGVAGRATASRPASQTAPEPLVRLPPPAPAPRPRPTTAHSRVRVHEHHGQAADAPGQETFQLPSQAPQVHRLLHFQ